MRQARGRRHDCRIAQGHRDVVMVGADRVLVERVRAANAEVVRPISARKARRVTLQTEAGAVEGGRTGARRCGA